MTHIPKQGKVSSRQPQKSELTNHSKNRIYALSLARFIRQCLMKTPLQFLPVLLLLLLTVWKVAAATSTSKDADCEGYDSSYDCLETHFCFWCGGTSCVTPPRDSSEWSAVSFNSSASSLEDIHWRDDSASWDDTSCVRLRSSSSDSHSASVFPFKHWYTAFPFLLCAFLCTCCVVACQRNDSGNSGMFVPGI